MPKDPKRLKRIGRFWAFVEGKLVVEGESIPKLGEKVYDAGMREVGVVSSILGPIDHFFIEINPAKEAECEEGEPLYVLEEKPKKKL